MPAADDEIPPSSQDPEVARVTGEAAAHAASTALAAPPDPTAGAFFDVDNTVMRGASIFHLARGLYARDFFSLHDVAGFAWQQLSFLARGENLEHIDQIQAKALGFIAGHSVAELRAVGEEVFDEIMATKIWPGTKALAQMHLDAGQRVWLVTATPVEVAEVIAHRLGLTGGLGTVAEHVDGIYTGRLVGSLLHGPAKVEAVRALAEREGLDLEPLLGVQRLRERHPAALPRREPVRDQPRPDAARPCEGARLAGARLPHRPQGGASRDPGGGRAPARSWAP